jgi:hypothetical protein
MVTLEIQRLSNAADGIPPTAETVSKLNFSFSPGFSLGFSVRLKLRNRFNGFPDLFRTRDIRADFGKPLKRFSGVRVTDNARLKPGENEKLSSKTLAD